MARTFRTFNDLLAVAVVVVAFGATATIHTVRVRAAESHYQVVENWAQFPPGVTKWDDGRRRGRARQRLRTQPQRIDADYGL